MATTSRNADAGESESESPDAVLPASVGAQSSNDTSADFGSSESSRIDSILRYVLAVVLVAAAAILLSWMEALWQTAAHVSIFLFAIIITAWYGGKKPALLAVALSILAFCYLFLPPTHSYVVGAPYVPRLILFGVVAMLIALGVASEKRATEALRRTTMELSEQKETLRESERKLAEAQRIAKLGYWERDLLNDRISWSGETLRIFGLETPPANVSQARLQEFIHPDDRARQTRAFNDALKGLGAYDVEYRIVRPDGDMRFLHVRDEVVYDASGKPVRMFGTVQDVTDRKRAEQDFSTLSEKSLQAIQIFQDGVIVYANPATTSIIGYSSEELKSMTPQQLLEIVHPDDRGLAESRARKRQSGEEVAPAIELRAIRKDGRTCWVQTFDSAIEFRGRQAVLRTSVDITERKQAEEALRRAEELFHAIVEDQTEMIVRWKPDGTRTFVNNAYCRTFAKSYEEIIGTSFWPLVSEDFREQEVQRIGKLTPNSPYSTGEHQSNYPDGTRHWQEWTDRGFFDEHGNLVELQSVGRDITDRKRAEQALREYADRLQHLSRRLLLVQEEERRHLARELHDEFGQLLAAITLYLHTAKGIAGASAQESLRECMSIVQRAGEQVRSLALELRPTMLEADGLDSTLRWLAEQHEQRTGIETKVVGHIEGVAGEVAIACFRIIQEALTNVAKHSMAKHVWIEMFQTDGELKLVVRDDGIGFDGSGTPGEGSSTGHLGLLGMRERVEILGGSLDVDSTHGKGTRIRVSVPYAEAPAEAA